jgi:hypothetical protein
VITIMSGLQIIVALVGVYLFALGYVLGRLHCADQSNG